MRQKRLPRRCRCPTSYLRNRYLDCLSRSPRHSLQNDLLAPHHHPTNVRSEAVQKVCLLLSQPALTSAELQRRGMTEATMSTEMKMEQACAPPITPLLHEQAASLEQGRRG